MDRRCRCRTPMPPNRRGRSHTKWRDRPRTWEAVRTLLAPVPAELGRGCARASSLRCMSRCTLIATVPALRCAPRSGHLGDECAAMTYTCARSTRPRRRAALPRKAHAAILLPPGPGGPAGVWRAYAILAGEGCAGRFATGRGVARSLRSLANRPGLRVPATPSGHRPSGLGRSRSPRGRGRQNGWASRPPATRPEASRRARDAATRMMSDGAGSRLERPERP